MVVPFCEQKNPCHEPTLNLAACLISANANVLLQIVRIPYSYNRTLNTLHGISPPPPHNFNKLHIHFAQ